MRWPSLIFLLVILHLLPGCGKPAAVPPPPENPAVAEVRDTLSRYFKVWSDKDIAAYGALFDPGATIVFVADGKAQTWQLSPFLESQRQAHAAATSPMTESAERMEIHLSPDGRVAQAAVKWKLVQQNRTTVGWDYFTLLRDAKGWHILNLCYYAE